MGACYVIGAVPKVRICRRCARFVIFRQAPCGRLLSFFQLQRRKVGFRQHVPAPQKDVRVVGYGLGRSERISVACPLISVNVRTRNVAVDLFRDHLHRQIASRPFRINRDCVGRVRAQETSNLQRTFDPIQIFKRAHGLCQRVHSVGLRRIKSKAVEIFPAAHLLHIPKARAVDKVCPRRRCALTRVAGAAVLRFRLNERPMCRLCRRGGVAVAAACQFVERAVVPNARNLESPRFGVLLLVEVARRSRPQTAVDTLSKRTPRGRVAKNVLRNDATRKHVVRSIGHRRAEMLTQPCRQLAHHKAVGLRAVDNRGRYLHAPHDSAVRGTLHDVALAFRVGRVTPPRQAHQWHGRGVATFGRLVVGIKARGQCSRLGVHCLNPQPRGANFGRAARCSYTVVSTAQNVTGTETGHVTLKALLQHHLPTAVGLSCRAFHQSVLGVENVAFAQCNAVNLIFGGTKETAHRHALKFCVSRRVDASPRAGGQSVGIVRRA